MKNKILIILVVFMIILAIVTYGVYNHRKQLVEAQKINNLYKTYENIQILGSELISIINRTIDIDEKEGIEKDQDGLYIDNGKDSIKIYIEFLYGDDETRTVEMEKIANSGIDQFINVYSTASFKCTNISYHEKTNNVKSLTFTQLQN